MLIISMKNSKIKERWIEKILSMGVNACAFKAMGRVTWTGSGFQCGRELLGWNKVESIYTTRW